MLLLCALPAAAFAFAPQPLPLFARVPQPQRCVSTQCSILPDGLVPLLLDNPNVLSFVAVGAAFNVLRPKEDPAPIGAPYAADAKAYDPAAADAFYFARLPYVLSRLAWLATLTGGFNIRLLIDWQLYKRAGSPEGESWPNEKDRAKEALGLATQLGPTFIKLAQALSIRTDLIPEAYALELRQLQDAVPAFDSAQAKAIMAEQLGVSGGASGLSSGLSSVFSSLSDEPLAAASIGQVYKGVLKDGRTVAVKVQRPNILDPCGQACHACKRRLCEGCFYVQRHPHGNPWWKDS